MSKIQSSFHLQNMFPLLFCFVLILCFTPWWKQTPKSFFCPVQWISQINIDFSLSFTVCCICFVLDLQHSVSYQHSLNSVDKVNDSLCSSLYLGDQGQCAVTSEQANQCLLDPCRIQLSVLLLWRIPNLSNNDKLLIENLKIVWQEMKKWTSLFIFNNSYVKWNGICFGELGREKKKIEFWMMNATFYPPVSNTSRKARTFFFF